MSVWQTFDDHWIEDPDTGCWVWQRARAGKGAQAGKGYGCFRIGRKVVLAHRYAYERRYGLIPQGLLAKHKCDNTLCVNPDHIEPGTNEENQAEAAARGLKPHRLTVEQVADIKARCARGELQRAVAADYDLHQGDVSHIVNGDYWKHVDAAA